MPPAAARSSTAGNVLTASVADSPALARFSSAPAASTLLYLVAAPADSAAARSASSSPPDAPAAACTADIADSNSRAAPTASPKRRALKYVAMAAPTAATLVCSEPNTLDASSRAEISSRTARLRSEAMGRSWWMTGPCSRARKIPGRGNPSGVEWFRRQAQARRAAGFGLASGLTSVRGSALRTGWSCRRGSPACLSA